MIDPTRAAPARHGDDLASVKKTSRLMCVYEGVKTLGIGAEISAAIAESDAFDYLDAPILRLGGAESPIPYSPVLEKAAVPQIDDIVAAARRLARGARLKWRSKSSCRASTWTWQSAKVTRWFAGEGESVAKGQPLFEIETDKAAMEVEAPASGVLRGVRAKSGDELPVGAIVGWIVGEVDESGPRQQAVRACAESLIAMGSPAGRRGVCARFR